MRSDQTQETLRSIENEMLRFEGLTLVNFAISIDLVLSQTNRLMTYFWPLQQTSPTVY